MRERIRTIIRDFVLAGRPGDETLWREPLVAFARADDPLFSTLKEAIGETHKTPRELLEGARTVIVTFLPFQRSIASGNAKGRHPSTAWRKAYVRTNAVIRDLTAVLSRELAGDGFGSAQIPPTHNFDPVTLTSDWSHKHAAFVAGLGTFGHHHMLITDKGCAGRLGSLVTDAEIEADARPEASFCLTERGETCLQCVSRCVFGALTAEGLDRRRCYEVCLANARMAMEGDRADVCGKCVAGVPCTFRNPAS
ncbi:MAG: 4Fe-4S binding protein [Planctomycetota bacterium]|jgi:epoxyqueuosine reductase QueG